MTDCGCSCLHRGGQRVADAVADVGDETLWKAAKSEAVKQRLHERNQPYLSQLDTCDDQVDFVLFMTAKGLTSVSERVTRGPALESDV